MTDINHAFETVLKKHSYSLTKQRSAVFRLLKESDPLTMNELITKLNGSVDKVSIYRTIELFEQTGIAQRLQIGWKYKVELTDLFNEHHHHLTCLTCGSIIDIQDEKHIETFINDVAKTFNFKPRKHHFEIDGYCDKCQ